MAKPDIGKVKETLLLEKGEDIVDSLLCRAYSKTVEQGGQKVFTIESDSGLLFLTNNRLIFLKETGVFSKEFNTLFTIPLKQIINVSTGGMMIKHLNVELQKEGGIQPVRFEANETEPFKKKIIEQRNNLKEAETKEVITAQKIIIEEKPDETPMEVLKRKLAKGEITTEEFHKRVQRM